MSVLLAADCVWMMELVSPFVNTLQWMLEQMDTAMKHTEEMEKVNSEGAAREDEDEKRDDESADDEDDESADDTMFSCSSHEMDDIADSLQLDEYRNSPTTETRTDRGHTRRAVGYVAYSFRYPDVHRAFMRQLTEQLDTVEVAMAADGPFADSASAVRIFKIRTKQRTT
jgi:hypothetical protein